MATQEEILKILLQVQGVDEVGRLRKEQEKLEADILKLTAAMQGQNAATIAANPAMQNLANQYHANAQRLDQLDTQLGRTRNNMAGVGQSFLQTGRIVQDFAQGGIGGVLNNIEGLSMALGGGAGLAGVLTAVGVAAFIAKPYIEEFIKSMKSNDVITFTGSIEKLKERIKELEEKKVRLAIDDAELKRLTKEVENLTKAAQFANQLLTKQTKAESASGRAVEDALVETPGAQEAIDKARRDAVTKAIAESQVVRGNNAKMAQQEKLIQDEQNKINNTVMGPGAEVVARRKIRDAQKKLGELREANKQAINGKGGIVEKEEAAFNQIELDAVTGKGRVQAAAQKKLAEILKGNDAGKAVADNSPQRVVEKEAEEEEEKLKKEAREVLKRQAEAKRKRAKEEEDARQNKENEENRLQEKNVPNELEKADAAKKQAEIDAKLNANVQKAGEERGKNLAGLNVPEGMGQYGGTNIAALFAQWTEYAATLPGKQRAEEVQRRNAFTKEAVASALREQGMNPAFAEAQANLAPDQMLDALNASQQAVGGIGQVNGQVAQIGGVIGELQSMYIRMNEQLKANNGMVRQLHQRQRTAQMWGR